MQLTSPSFSEGGTIPDRFTCDGDDVSPQLDVVGVPAEATVLALVMDDPDAPQATWDHWVVFDVPVTESIVEDVGPIGVAGANSWGDVGYGGPCPPSGTHRYVFRVFAFAEPLGLGEGSSKADLLAAAEGNVLAEASLTAFYGR
jgi:Raf kinase inhibitor-like YbhB/YbcL family protein